MTWTHTTDLSDRFFVELDAIASRLGTSKVALSGVMMSESGVSASKKNPSSSATGLIQFMSYYGMTRAQFAALDAADQLNYVERYLAQYKGKLSNTPESVYLAVFLPAQLHLAADPYATVAAKNGPYGWAFSANAYFDFNGDMAIQVSELGVSIALQCEGPRWEEICRRANIPYVPNNGAPYDLRRTFGIQSALRDIGYDPGPVDGIVGRRTLKALMAFQSANRLVPDGVPGPRTRGSLLAALRKLGGVA